MTATQAQDYASAVLAIALRTQSRKRSDVHAALDNGSVVRSWPMRGTLHFVAAEDLPWMLALTAERSLATSEKYRAQLGLELAAIEQAREIAIETLSGGGRISRADLLATWEKAGHNVKEHGYRLIWHLSQTQTLCLGPTGLAQLTNNTSCCSMNGSPHVDSSNATRHSVSGRCATSAATVRRPSKTSPGGPNSKLRM